jgi:hypothetical protein
MRDKVGNRRHLANRSLPRFAIIMTGKGRPAVAHEPTHRLLRLANDLDFNDQDHHNPRQADSMLLHRVLLSDTPVGPIPHRRFLFDRSV